MNIKKMLLLATMLTASTLTFSEGRNIIETRASGTFNGNYKSFNHSKDKKTDAENGYEINAEWLREIYSDTYFGLGIGYQKHGNIKSDNNEGSKDLFSSVPLYFALKHQFNTDGLIQPFVKANFGASFNRDENGITKDYDESVDKLGYYAALGGGFEIDNFILDLSYEINSAKVKETKEDIDFARFSLGLGYRFDF